MSADAPPRLGQTTPFRQRTTLILAGVGVVSFVAAVIMAIYAEPDPPSPAGANSYSRSALGHRAFVELLRAVDVPVLVSEHDTAAKVESAVLVVVEPIVATAGGGAVVDDVGDGVTGDRMIRVRAMITASDAALVVLPKWYGVSDPERPAWVEAVALLDEDEVEAPLSALGVFGAIVRVPDGTAWFGGGVQVAGYPGVDPARIEVRGAQLLAPTEGLTPLIAGDRGALLASTYVGTTRVLILSDPDVLANHGLHRGDNAVLATSIIDDLRRGNRVVVIDETIHGFDRKPSIWRALFEFPLATTTIAALLTVLLLLWAATARFGKALPPPPAIAPGKGFLIDNTAVLLRAGGHGGHALSRYLQATVQDVGAALHAPREAQGDGLPAWLDRIGAARGVRVTASALEREVAKAVARAGGRDAEPRVVELARSIYQWKQEMIHGTGIGQGNQ